MMSRISMFVLFALVVTYALLMANPASRLNGEERDGKNASAPEPETVGAKAGKPLSKFMRQKLDASNEVLEGLATEDFALIEKGAASMKRLSSAEQWQVSNDALYRQHSNQFRRVMEKLEKTAKEKQLDAAALSWVEGTMSCLECHKWVRSNIIAQ